MQAAKCRLRHHAARSRDAPSSMPTQVHPVKGRASSERACLVLIAHEEDALERLDAEGRQGATPVVCLEVKHWRHWVHHRLESVVEHLQHRPCSCCCHGRLPVGREVGTLAGSRAHAAVMDVCLSEGNWARLLDPCSCCCHGLLPVRRELGTLAGSMLMLLSWTSACQKGIGHACWIQHTALATPGEGQQECRAARSIKAQLGIFLLHGPWAMPCSSCVTDIGRCGA